MENNWWGARKTAQIQSYANISDIKSFYEAMSTVITNNTIINII